MSAALATRPAALDADDITITVDIHGREVIVVPDAVVAGLTAAVKGNWTEYRGVNTGQSERFPAGSWAYDTTRMIMDVYADSDAPETDDPRDAAYHRRDRQQASGNYPALYAIIVSASGWDLDAGNWTDGVYSNDYTVPGNPSVSSRGTDFSIMFTG